jgi:hypothetical protein
MTKISLYNYVAADVATLIRIGDPSPASLLRHTPGLVAILTGEHTPGAAPAAHSSLLEAVETLVPPADHAARTLLGIGLAPRETLTHRRKIAAEPYGVGPAQFRRAYERDLHTALTIAVAARADPRVTRPSTRGAPSIAVPPPASAFRPRYLRPSSSNQRV